VRTSPKEKQKLYPKKVLNEILVQEKLLVMEGGRTDDKGQAKLLEREKKHGTVPPHRILSCLVGGRYDIFRRKERGENPRR